MLVTFLSHRPWSGLPEEYRDLIASVDRLGPTIILSPEIDESANSPIAAPITVSLDRPLELQVDMRAISGEWPVVVALHPSVEPLTHSRSIPSAWVCLEQSLTLVEASASLAARAGVVIVEEAIRSLLAISDQKYLPTTTSAEAIRHRLGELLQPKSQALYDAALGAQIFHRTKEVQRILSSKEDHSIPLYRKIKMAGRVERPGDYAESMRKSISQLGDVGDALGAAIMASHLPAEGLEPAIEAVTAHGKPLPPFVLFLLGLKVSEARGEVYIPEAWELGTPSYRTAWITHLDRAKEAIPALTSNQADLVLATILRPAERLVLGPALIEALPLLAARANVPMEQVERVLHDIAENSGGVTAMAAELMLIRSDLERGDPDVATRIDELLALIDTHAPHPGLWASATTYWRQMSGEHWRGEHWYEDDHAPTGGAADSLGGLVTADESNDLNENNLKGQEALRSGDFARAAQLFRRVQSLALTESPVNATQELAARLNCGWALWMDGRAPNEWKPLVVSVLEETCPRRAMVQLRAMCAVTAEVINNPETHLRSVTTRLRSKLDAILKDPDAIDFRVLIEELIEEVDQHASHRDLWRSGLTYWGKMTGEDWSPTELDPPPPIRATHAAPPTANAISKLDRSARSALRRNMRKRAIRLFEEVRERSLAHTPPLESTERAARLNIAWAMWERGVKRQEWSPYITSVLQEAGPDAALVELRQIASAWLVDETSRK